MNFRTRLPLWGLLCMLPLCGPLTAQSTGSQPGAEPADLQLVIVLSRHGVRSPLGTPGMFDKYAAAPWPKWEVPSGILTPHGYDLMKLVGAWDRIKFSKQGLLAPTGCSDAAHVDFIADSDQRTRETGRALAEGMLPGCAVPVHAQPEGANDPLFRPVEAGVVHPNHRVEVAAVAGRIGGDPKNLTEAYRSQLATLDKVLAGCGRIPANPQRTSIFDIPAGIVPGSGDTPVSLRGPVTSSATIAENLLLAYTDGKSDADAGWGCLDGATLRTVMQIDSVNWDYSKRTPAVSRTIGSNLLNHIQKTLEQSATGKAIPGALGKPDDRLIVLVGHDTNIVATAGALGLNWVLDGRADDTPPGGALIFELWRSHSDEKLFLRLKYTAQTLEQMRKSETLTEANPPAEAQVAVPGCSGPDISCTWDEFSAAMQRAIDPVNVDGKP